MSIFDQAYLRLKGGADAQPTTAAPEPQAGSVCPVCRKPMQVRQLLSQRGAYYCEPCRVALPIAQTT